MLRIYFDHNATTPVHPAVLEAMLPYLAAEFGNPSSAHRFGQRARQAIEGARESLAALIGARPSEIVFTSGGTEADNMAILGVARGVARAAGSTSRHAITCAIEHPAVLMTMKQLQREGVEVTTGGVQRVV